MLGGGGHRFGRVGERVTGGGGDALGGPGQFGCRAQDLVGASGAAMHSSGSTADRVCWVNARMLSAAALGTKETRGGTCGTRIDRQTFDAFAGCGRDHTGDPGHASVLI
jgi:hypothetical protein